MKINCQVNPPLLNGFILLLTLVYIVKGQGQVTISTELGNITGLRRTLESRYVYEFRKIPYAKPPLGKLRFEKPVKFGSWENSLDATNFGPSCFQEIYPLKLPNLDRSEDCLHLNIYVPREITPTVKKSVMVWIHGGGFSLGQGMLYDGAFLAITGNVIVVTINYRLGIFGFFSTGNEIARGNYGLWDQIMAIQWVKDHIGSYGGDSNSITIFGESAGAMSVGLLSIMPQNKGLFQRGIQQSGTALFPFDEFYRYLNMSSLTASLNCVNSNLTIVVNCMKQLTSEQFIPAMQIPFAPVVDGELISDDPNKLLNDAKSEASLFFQSIDTMIGTCSSEGSLFISEAYILQEEFGFNITEGIPKAVLCDYLATNIEKNYKDSRVTPAICNEYGQERDSVELSMNILNAYADYYFNVLAVRALRLHSRGLKQSKRFHYLFSRRPAKSFSSEMPPWFIGAAHADELVYQFNMFPMTLEDTKLMETLNKYWSNFAKSGNVNYANLPHWEEYNRGNEAYIDLDINITSGEHLYKDRIDFWLIDIPNILKPITTIEPISRACNIYICMYNYSIYSFLAMMSYILI